MASGKEGEAITLQSMDGGSRQVTVHPVSNRKKKGVTLVVWTMDPSQQGTSVLCEDGTRSTAGQLKAKVMELFGVDPSYSGVFAVWMTSSELSIQLKDYHMPCKLYRKWKDLLTEYTSAKYMTIQTDEPILTLKRNAFLTLKEERKIKDVQVIHLLYREAVFNVVHNRYPMLDDELVELAGIQAVFNLQGKDPGEFLGHYFRNKVGEYFPEHMLPVKKSTLSRVFSRTSTSPTLEDQLASKYEEVYRRLTSPPGAYATLPVDIMHYYLQRCRSKPYYGSVFFGGQVDKHVKLIQALLPRLKDRSIVVAINTEGVYIFEDAVPREMMLQLPLDLLSSNLHDPHEDNEISLSCLWLEWELMDQASPKGGTMRVVRQLPIYSRQAAMMDAMISRCVDELKLSEKQLCKKRKGEEAPVYRWETNGPKVRKKVRKQEKRLVCETLMEEGASPPKVSTVVTSMPDSHSYSVAEERVINMETNPCYAAIQANPVYEPIEEGASPPKVSTVVSDMPDNPTFSTAGQGVICMESNPCYEAMQTDTIYEIVGEAPHSAEYKII